MSEQRDDDRAKLQPVAPTRLPAPAMPFAAIAGQAELKLALLLAGVQPHLGGVLVTGKPGTTPAATARAFASVLPAGAPFVEVPRSADVDRLVGTATRPDRAADTGLLQQVDGGVLFLDGIDRFPENIVEVVLDAHDLGFTRVERNGASLTCPSRFVMVATTDGPVPARWATHFGLSVDATGLHQADHRVEATRRQLNFEHDPSGFIAKWEDKQRDLRRHLDLARPAEVPTQLLTPIGWLTAEIGVVNIGADMALARGAAALAGWEGRHMATESDLAAVAPMVLRHQPVADGEHGPDGGRLEVAIGRFTSSARKSIGETPSDEVGWVSAPPTPPSPKSSLQASSTNHDAQPDARGVGERSRSRNENSSTAAEFTDVVTRSAADLAATEPESEINAADRRLAWSSDTRLDLDTPARSRQRVPNGGRQATDLVVLSVDASGSRDSETRVLAASGALLRTLAAAPDHAMEVSLVTFGGDSAKVVLGPTSSIEVARSKLVEVTVGGGSPLAAGLQSALSVATLHSSGKVNGRSLLVLVTDGRANVTLPAEAFAPVPVPADETDVSGSNADATDGPAVSETESAGPETPQTETAAVDKPHTAESALADAEMVADRVSRRGFECVLIFTGEDEVARQAMRSLALRMGATFLTLPELSAQSLAAAVRNLTAAVPAQRSKSVDTAESHAAEGQPETTQPASAGV